LHDVVAKRHNTERKMVQASTSNANCGSDKPDASIVSDFGYVPRDVLRGVQVKDLDVRVVGNA
jgi:hypothetical protein